MKFRTTFVVSLTIALLFSMSTSVFGCACCADRGTYSVTTGKLAAYELNLLKEMKFGTTAELYLTAGGDDDLKGIPDLTKELEMTSSSEFDLIDAYTGLTWTLRFMTAGELKGSLVLPRPTQMTSRKVHIPDNTSTSPDVSLYKEWIFSGSVRSGSGFFRRGIVRPTVYTLIFQGRGNMCDNAEDFTNWRLSVIGPRASFAFFGRMKAASAS